MYMCKYLYDVILRRRLRYGWPAASLKAANFPVGAFRENGPLSHAVGNSGVSANRCKTASPFCRLGTRTPREAAGTCDVAERM